MHILQGNIFVMNGQLERSEKLKLFSVLATVNAGEIVKGDTVPYTSVNGHMYAYLSKEGDFNLRLPEPELTQVLQQYQTTHAMSYGVVQKEYVLIPDVLLTNEEKMKALFARSYQYVSSLKPKPTKGKKG